jgi:hypothetical protein
MARAHGHNIDAVGIVSSITQGDSGGALLPHARPGPPVDDPGDGGALRALRVGSSSRPALAQQREARMGHRPAMPSIKILDVRRLMHQERAVSTSY